MKVHRFFLIMAVLVIMGCATTHTADNFDVRLLPETQQARIYQENGQYEEAIESYRQLIAANPKHFKSVLYQHEIMKTTEALSDPYRLLDEINRTVEMFNTASNESFDGATSDELEHEQKKLFEDISGIASMFHSVYGVTKNDFYQSFSFKISGIALSLYPNDQSDCDYIFTKANLSLNVEHYEEAVKLYENVLDNCDDGKLKNHSNSYVDAAHGYLIACNSLNHSDSCPTIPKTPEAELGELQEYPEHPIAECRLKFIDAANRFNEVLQKYPDEKLDIFNVNAQYLVAIIYFAHNQFDKADPIFKKVIDTAPKSEAAVYACNFILESYRTTKKYKEMLDFVREIKKNHDFMSNSTGLMPELIEVLNEFEEALIEVLGTDGGN